MAETPVLTSTDPEQLESFTRFIAELRTNNVRIAAEEARRLGPYFKALSTVLAVDQKEANDIDPESLALSKPGALSKLFNRVAKSTKNTILSGLVIAPMTIFETQGALEGTTQFSAPSSYNNRSFRFGFIQTFNDNKNGSASIPVLAFDDGLMELIASFKPEALLKALQTIATSSNHDMQHHYTSPVLNAAIAQTVKDKELPEPDGLDVMDWSRLYFNKAEKDSDPKSYEAWLMFNHARVRRLLEEGPEGEALKQACNIYFAELKRIGAEITVSASPKMAHEVVDYFGTMALFALSRSMPLDHPLMDHAVRGLQQADPDADAIKKRKDEILWRIENPEKGDELAEQAIANYRAKGAELVRREHDYVSLKKLQLINIEPWVAHLMSPGRPDTGLGEAQQRVGEVNREMLNASAVTSWFGATDGLHTTKRANGETMEAYFKDGQLHRTDGPALVMKDKEGQTIGEQWFQNGKRFRADGGPDFYEMERPGRFYEASLGTAMDTGGKKRAETREWHDEEGRLRHKLSTNSESNYRAEAYREFYFDENGKHHNDNGPALLIKDAAGTTVEETWQLHDILHREDGPAIIKVAEDGSREEIWYKNGQIHNENGPARIVTADDGTRRKEVWMQNGGVNREGAPAVITISPNGTRTEEWYSHSKRHNENGPAYVRKAADGTIIEAEWYIDGQRIEPPVNSPFTTGTKSPNPN